jgi:hypothetical protein
MPTGALLGAAAVAMHISNAHDRSRKIVMTAVFFAGPIGAAIGFLVGLLKR